MIGQPEPQPSKCCGEFSEPTCISIVPLQRLGCFVPVVPRNSLEPMDPRAKAGNSAVPPPWDVPVWRAKQRR